ncbi:MAG: sulfite exporter TauE/SafE family protein, partial [Clostridiales Family XIII bacterium]|nr:sulfite exporter TauE/SafE family protein [Clostridiales Family XIII bacterium]
MKSKKRRNHRYVDAEERLSQEDLTSVSLSIDGMTCQNCQNKIERKLQNTTGVLSANVSYSAGTAKVTYDANQISGQEIEAAIEQLHYRVRKGTDLQEPMTSRVVALLSIILLLYVLLQHFGLLNLLAPSRLADAKMGYGMLFVIGLITSVHCLAMCGGINLSQSLPKVGAPSTFVPAFLYNLGRVISYTGIGFILGLVGFLLGGGSSVGLPTMVQGLLKLVAGVFMVIMGINMLGLFPWLRRFTLRMPGFLARKIDAGKAQNKSPFLVGLLNGLMPCGPLQSMQIVALASGNPFVGALSMFLFSLGTVPLMLGFGSIVSA